MWTLFFTIVYYTTRRGVGVVETVQGISVNMYTYILKLKGTLYVFLRETAKMVDSVPLYKTRKKPSKSNPGNCDLLKSTKRTSILLTRILWTRHFKLLFYTELLSGGGFGVLAFPGRPSQEIAARDTFLRQILHPGVIILHFMHRCLHENGSFSVHFFDEHYLGEPF